VSRFEDRHSGLPGIISSTTATTRAAVLDINA